jgi:hypothetical protein
LATSNGQVGPQFGASGRLAIAGCRELDLPMYSAISETPKFISMDKLLDDHKAWE